MERNIITGFLNFVKKVFIKKPILKKTIELKQNNRFRIGNTCQADFNRHKAKIRHEHNKIVRKQKAFERRRAA
jgi:hypothetical protein